MEWSVSPMTPDQLTKGDELLACPFCSARPLNVHENAGLWWVSCTGCEAEMSWGTKEGAVERWNRRTLPAALKDREGVDVEVAARLHQRAKEIEAHYERFPNWSDAYMAQHAADLCAVLAPLTPSHDEVRAFAAANREVVRLRAALKEIAASEDNYGQLCEPLRQLARAALSEDSGGLRCVNHPNLPSRTNLDGEELCQGCADSWTRVEGEAAHDLDELISPTTPTGDPT